ncbi:MAG: hypothetical protein ACK5EO_13085, partial [Planctomycetota bacterium]
QLELLQLAVFLCISVISTLEDNSLQIATNLYLLGRAVPKSLLLKRDFPQFTTQCYCWSFLLGTVVSTFFRVLVVDLVHGSHL